MNTAEKIYNHVRTLPEPVAQEIFDFVEFLEKKLTSERASVSRPEDSGWPDIILAFEGAPDMPPFEQDRPSLSPPSEDPLS